MGTSSPASLIVSATPLSSPKFGSTTRIPSIRSHADVLTVVDALPRIEPVWLPTYAPWLNPIEKLWRWLRQDVLKLHRLADDWPELQRRVNAFLDQFATGSHELLRYAGLSGDGSLAQALRVA